MAGFPIGERTDNNVRPRSRRVETCRRFTLCHSDLQTFSQSRAIGWISDCEAAVGPSFKEWTRRRTTVGRHTRPGGILSSSRARIGRLDRRRSRRWGWTDHRPRRLSPTTWRPTRLRRGRCRSPPVPTSDDADPAAVTACASFAEALDGTSVYYGDFADASKVRTTPTRRSATVTSSDAPRCARRRLWR